MEFTLAAIACQSRPPDEIVISDSSKNRKTEQTVISFCKANPQFLVNYVRSENKALPFHRWNGFQHSQGEIVFFMDDDIILDPDALKMLEYAYLDLFSRYGVEEIAGVGFCTIFDDGSEKMRRPDSFEERWLRITHEPSASITAGGLGIPPKGMPMDSLIEVGRLVGGRMTFRRDVLLHVGLLDQLIDLYNRGLGRGEDTVLSYQAGKFGKLFVMTAPPVIHPRDDKAIKSAFATDGLRKGLAETWGRAHTMRWMSTNQTLYRQQWMKVAALELLRSVWWGIVRKPLAVTSWTRFWGAIYGLILGLFFWKRIPSSARSEVS